MTFIGHPPTMSSTLMAVGPGEDSGLYFGNIYRAVPVPSRRGIGQVRGDGQVARKLAELIKDVILGSEFLQVLVTFTGLLVAVTFVLIALLWLLL